jgi:AAA family ATP:ADP antiporter
MATTAAPLRRLTRITERIVGADVHEGEWGLVLLFSANLFLLLSAYYILKVIREPLILLAGSAVRRSYARGLQAAVLVALIPVYSALANRVEPARLVNGIMGLFLASLVAFFAAGWLGLPIGFPFFVWLGVFSALSIAQFWSLANDHLTEEEGRRLFPLVAVGGTIGGIVGAQLAARGIARLTPEQMMLVAAVILAACMALTHAGHHAGRGLRARAAVRPARERDHRGGFTLVLRDRYLLLIGLSVLVVNLITTTGDFILAQMVSGKAHALPAAERSHYISAFYGDLQTWITVSSALVQVLIVARAFKKVGVGGALLFMPLLVVAGYGLFAALPLLATAAVVKVGEGTTDYSLQNTIEQALFLPTSVDAKYKAKSAIDTVSKRLGDLGSTALVFVGTSLGLRVFGFAVVNVLAGVVWMWLCVQLRRRQLALATPAPAPATAAPEMRRRYRLPALFASAVFVAAAVGPSVARADESVVAPRLDPSQHFTIDPVVDGVIIAGGAGFSFLLGQILSTGEIRPSAPGDPSNLLAIDRVAVTQNIDRNAGAYSDAGLYAAYGFALLDPILSGVRDGRRALLVDAVLYAESIAITQGFTDATKIGVRRPRPIDYVNCPNGQSATGADCASTDLQLSFFSGHASATGAIGATATYLAFVRSGPRAPRPWITLGAATLLTAFVSYERVRSGEHFPTDVIMGAMAGAAIGVLVPRFHLRAHYHGQELEAPTLWIGYTPVAGGGTLGLGGRL